MERASRPLTGLVAFLAAGLFIAIGFWPPPPPSPSTRRLDLDRLERLVETIPAAGEARRAEIMAFLVEFFRDPLLAGCCAKRIPTPTARHDHAALARRIGELEGAARDADLFRLRAHALVALFLEHDLREEAVSSLAYSR